MQINHMRCERKERNKFLEETLLLSTKTGGKHSPQNYFKNPE